MGAPPPLRGEEEEDPRSHRTAFSSHQCINSAPLQLQQSVLRNIHEFEEEDPMDMEEEEESDWANLHLLHHTARQLELSMRQSASQISGLRNQLECREREVSELRDQLRSQEARERNLVEQNRSLRVQLMAQSASPPQLLSLSPSRPTKAVADKGIQVSISLPTSPLRHPLLSSSLLGGSSSSPQPRQPFLGMTPLPESPSSLLSSLLGDEPRRAEEDAVRLEAPPLMSRLPQGQGQIERQPPSSAAGLLGAGGILSSSEPTNYVDRQSFLAWRRRRRLTMSHRRNSPELLGLQRHVSLPRVRPLIKRRNGMKHGGGEVIGYRWTHYTRHEFLRDPYLPPNPFLEEDEEEEDLDEEEEEEEADEGQEDDQEEVENENEEEDQDVEEEEESENDEELSDEEYDEEMGEAEVIDVIDLVDDDDGDEPEKKLLEDSKASVSPKVEGDGIEPELEQKNPPQEVQQPPQSSTKQELKENSVGSCGKSVEVPKWRQLVLEPIIREEELSPATDLEMEEDISEAALLRRHARLELDEKRRKRWDSQRAREETYLEKLKRKMEERENSRFATGRRKVSGAGRKPGSGKLGSLGKGKAAKNNSVGAGTKVAPSSGAGANVVPPLTIATTSKAGSAVKGKTVSIPPPPGAVGASTEDSKIKESDDDESDVDGGAGKRKKELDLDDDVLYVRVADDIPISIFGHPLPMIEYEEFELPWPVPELPDDAPVNNPNPIAVPGPLSPIKMEPGSSVKTEVGQPLLQQLSSTSKLPNNPVDVKPEPELPPSSVSTSSENEKVPVEVEGGPLTGTIPSSTSVANLASIPSEASSSPLSLSPPPHGAISSSDGQSPTPPGSPSLLGSLLGKTMNVTAWLRR